MLLGNRREDHHSDCRISRSVPHLIPSVPKNDPFISQQTMMNYARMSYRYTTVTLLSMRPPPELTIFPDHLVERRFLDDENYIDLDRMLAEKAGKFQMDSYGMHDGAGDGPSTSFKTFIHDVPNPNATEKVKNRRSKDPLTPHQVAALTSVATRHQTSTIPTPLLTSQSIPPLPHTSIDDYNHRQMQTQRSMSYQRQNSNHFQTQPHQVRSLPPDYRPSHTQTTTPILQRLFQAHERQHSKNDLSPPCTHHPHRGQSAFCTPVSPEQSANSHKTFAWPFPTNPNQRSATHPIHIPMTTQSIVKQNQNVLSQLLANHLPSSTTMQTHSTPAVHNNPFNSSNRGNSTEDDNDDDDEQKFYSAPPSPTQQQEFSPSGFNNSNNPEHTRIYNQAVLLNSLIRNMINENNVQNSSSNESCSSNDTQSTSWNQDSNASYTEMYNLIRLLSPGVKNVAQQELLQYLEQGCSNEREDMLRLIRTLSIDEQNSLKPVLVRLINEQLDIMKAQQHTQQGHSISNEQDYSPTNRSSLESWFGSDIYKNAYPRMPSGRVVSAHDLETSRFS